ncbi:NADPH:quinone reductase [Pseudoclavibacter endophyticus]|uniref:NAD(P)-dependent alcohol dehydrogenase n=1 Tax=Pseudoclavibacter endophyticus TaxID=1778590 RepID=A0A6H9WLN5_9MICO|nr:NAD(P)-dependent alcohol dehydrogenase [Pseudoclavibacter endophyticus]KAB1649736.1 NAD(P)-dependent alcohol dehydrogenase [Pseudoclavibacter endophyticus]GGA60146.1 NADPH:quinone reductase [Pseudoclavibacter endophyticus]
MSTPEPATSLPEAPAIPATMRAWSRRDYGPADGTTATDIPVPTPRKNEVLLRIRATAINAGDVRILLGDPLLVRAAFGLRRPKQPVRGMDVAGTVVAVGPGVIDARVGDEVVGELPGGGGLATYAVAPVDRLVARPSTLDPVVATTLPIAAGTAHQALSAGGLGAPELAGKRVLVLGASGGVGTFAVQLAVLRGAEVWASCGEPNRQLVGELGAARTFDYRATRVDELPRDHFDAVIDIAGGDRIGALQRLLVVGGALVQVTGNGGPVFGPIPRMLSALVHSIGSSRRIPFFAAAPKRDVLAELVGLVADRRIAPVIEAVYDFDETVAALEHVEAGHTVGKVVVRGEPAPGA